MNHDYSIAIATPLDSDVQRHTADTSAQDTPFRQMILEQFARIGKAMSNEHRLSLLEFLGQGERTVESLAELTGLSVANTSQHLQQLRQTGIVATRKKGLYVYYRLVDDSIVRLLQTLRQVGKLHLAEVDRLVSSVLDSKDRSNPISHPALMKMLAKGTATILDVRPEDEYAAGHLPSAISIPLAQLANNLSRIPKDKNVVVYCRGPYCQLAYDAVQLLREKGFKAQRMEEGFPEWRCASLPIETGGVVLENA